MDFFFFSGLVVFLASLRLSLPTPYLADKLAMQTKMSKVTLAVAESRRSVVMSQSVARTAVQAPMNAQPKKGVSVLANFWLRKFGRRPSLDRVWTCNDQGRMTSFFQKL